MRATMMRLAAGAMVLGALGGARADTPPTISVINHATSAIVEVYVSGIADDSWGDDRLGEQPVPPNRTFRLAAGSITGCVADIRVVYADGRAEDKRRVDLCRNRDVSFDASAAAVPQDADTQRVTFTNDTHRTITALYLSSASSSDWGDNRLPHPIAAGAQKSSPMLAGAWPICGWCSTRGRPRNGAGSISAATRPCPSNLAGPRPTRSIRPAR